MVENANDDALAIDRLLHVSVTRTCSGFLFVALYCHQPSGVNNIGLKQKAFTLKCSLRNGFIGLQVK